jgi:predicted secreted protein
MSITAAFVLFAVCWFMTFFIVLPLRLTTQGDAGQVTPGTPAGAPAGFVVRRKARITTMVALVVWALISSVILSGWITVRDFDVMGRMPPLEVPAN